MFQQQSHHICIPKGKLLMNSFFISQFNYCPLVQMCHSRLINKKLIDYMKNAFVLFTATKLHPLKNYQKKTDLSPYTQEIYKYLRLKCLKFMGTCCQILQLKFFALAEIINLRHSSFFLYLTLKTVQHGSESLSNLEPRIWDLKPSTLKKLDDDNSFKTQIKKW